MIDQIKKHINKLYDDYTMKLLHMTDLNLNKEYSHFELLCPNKTILKNTEYTIVRQISPIDNKENIMLYQNNEIVAGYEFNVVFEDNTIKINVEKF